MPMTHFDAAYSRTEENDEQQDTSDRIASGEVQQLVDEYGGTAYSDGLYRIFAVNEIVRWSGYLQQFFPAESSHVEAFGRDWQGNIFGFRPQNSPCVLLFQPGTGDVFEIAGSIQEFHNQELTHHAEESLSLSLWLEWRQGNPGPTASQCVAYRKPVFLGGEVSVDNLAIADVQVYWDVIGQLLVQIRGLAPGTPIRGVNLTYLQ